MYGDAYGPLFTYDWPGLRNYYLDSFREGPAIQTAIYDRYCNASLSKTITKKVRNNKGGLVERTYEASPGGDAFPMIQISAFGGNSICAKFSKLNYDNIKFLEDGSCPDGFKECETTGGSKRDKHVCIPEDVPASCPVRDIHLIHKNDA